MINVYLNDYERWNVLKKLWQKYNAIVIVAFSLVLLSCSAFKYWQWHKQTRLQQASNNYERMMLAAANHQTKQVNKLAKELVAQFPNSIYADAARLSLAKSAVAAKNYAEAEAQLKQVAEESSTYELAVVAKIRLSRLWLSHQRYKEALGILNGLKNDAYLPLVDELRGDIYTGMNKFDKAVEFYRKALSEVQNYGVGNLFLEMKSHDILALSNQKAQELATDMSKKNDV